METETLSTYEQNREKHLDNTMDVDIANNEEESVSSVNKTYEETTESTEKENGKDNSLSRIEMESDEECEEEEEKLLLSPAHSDKAYDSDDAGDVLSPELTRDLSESETEAEKGESEENVDKNKLDESRDDAQDISDKEEESDKVKDTENIEEESDKVKDTENSEEESDKVKDTENSEEESDKVKDTENSEVNKQLKVNTEDSKITLQNDNSITNHDTESDIQDRIETDQISDKNNIKEDEGKSKEEIDQSHDNKTNNENVVKDPSEEQVNENSNQDINEHGGDKKNAIQSLEDKQDKEDEMDSKSSVEVTDVEEKVDKNENDGNGDKNENDGNGDKRNSEEEVTTIDENKIKDNEKEEQVIENKESKSGDDTVNESKSESCKPDESTNKINDNEVSKESNEDKGPISEEKSESGKQENADTSSGENMETPKKEESSLLKETLSKPIADDAGKEPDMDEEMDMDEDFDPSLLCPELSMEVDEAPVITTNDAVRTETDGNKSPLRLYDPIFSTFVDEMTGAEVDFNLTAEELELKAKTYGSKNPIQFTKIHCTACNIHLGSALDGQGNRFVHPLLKVLICKKCFHFYTSGEFEKDEDGSELYCRWCGQGGQVMCCANCEMVFCKKCIRINFDRRKLTDIQRSDDWLCFKCNPSQLIHLRIHCAEFMEYVQSELRLAGSSGNVEAFMNTDYCQCCIPPKKKAPDAAAADQPKPKKRRRGGEDDPDYNPIAEAERPAAVPSPAAAASPAATPATPQQQPVTVTPKAASNLGQPRPNMVRTPMAQQTRPRMPVVTPPGARPPAPGYVRVMPGGIRLATPSQINASTRPPALRPIRPTSTMKHEWFEKTVRAAARVNSNLSYTLTQLNRAQANASSVEALAVVHNKLQEILSSSINSLIQIRKNLRTEFIAGIKNIRFPAKAPAPTATPSTSKDDDDVIFIPSDPPLPPPPLVPVRNTTNNTNRISLPPSVTLTKKSPTAPTITDNSKPGPSGITKKTTAPPEDIKPKGFLRVKSFSALQSVPSECITIPDDPIEEEKADDVEIVKEKDPLAVAEEENEKIHALANGDDQQSNDSEVKCDIPKSVNTLTDAELLKSIKPAKIILERSNEIDELVKSKFALVNGIESDSAEVNE